VRIENGQKFGIHNVRNSLSNWHVNKAADGCSIFCFFAAARERRRSARSSLLLGADKNEGTYPPQSKGLLPPAGDFGEKEKRKAPPSKSAQAVPSDMPLATSLG
jgi:hypothetical protein